MAAVARPLVAPRLVGSAAGIGHRDSGTQPTADARANGSQLATAVAISTTYRPPPTHVQLQTARRSRTSVLRISDGPAMLTRPALSRPRPRLLNQGKDHTRVKPKHARPRPTVQQKVRLIVETKNFFRRHFGSNELLWTRVKKTSASARFITQHTKLSCGLVICQGHDVNGQGQVQGCGHSRGQSKAKNLALRPRPRITIPVSDPRRHHGE